MSWAALLEIIRREAGDELMARIEARARQEMGGTRITIGKKPLITQSRIDAVSPGKPKEAAKQLGVHYSTIYRALNRRQIR